MIFEDFHLGRAVDGMFATRFLGTGSSGAEAWSDLNAAAGRWLSGRVRVRFELYIPWSFSFLFFLQIWVVAC